MQPILLSWSGGKDAAWTLHTLRQQGIFAVVGLFTTLTEGFDRISMQGIRRDVLHAQAEAVGLPVIESYIPQKTDNAGYEAAFAEALHRAKARWPNLSHIAYGDLLLEDVKRWREALCERLGWQAIFPIFGQDTAQLAREMVSSGVETRLCCVDSTQLAPSFSGRQFDTALLDALPASVDPCGENGEFHTCITNGPMFNHALSLTQGEQILRDNRFAYADFYLSSTPASNACA